MFNLQKTCNVKEETKILIMMYNKENTLVKKVEEALDISLSDFLDESYNTVYTLGKLPTKKILLIDENALNNTKKQKDIYQAITKLKEDCILLLDTFHTDYISALFEGLTKAMYRFSKFKSEDQSNPINIAYTTKKSLDDDIHEGIVLGEAINHTRELVNTPYNYLNSEQLADYAKTLETLDNIKVTIYEKDACESMHMGAYLGVNKGSKDAPKLIHIEYRGNQSSKEITSLVGKGVMYDTGGYSLKTPQSMPTMKMDMGGAATVLGAIEAIARLKAEANVHVVIAATDNRIGDDAIVPDDILTSAKGITIEIISTDAEGRLTLADALWFAQEKGATKLIDIATLTGAIVGALGSAYTGAFTNNDTYLKTLSDMAQKANEPVWQMPISDEYRDELKSYAADIQNKGGRLAGASIAAAFLEKFVEKDIPWIHLDIAGTVFNKKDGGTGVMVKTLTKLFV